MRIPFPERLSLFQVFVFAVVLGALQQLEGTSAIFSLGTFCFIMISTLAFNLAGGLTRPSGGYIFAFATLAALAGIVYKVILNEPGQRNLAQPERTIEVYVGAAVALWAGVFLSHKLSFKKNFFPRFKSDEDMYRAAIGSMFIGGAIQLFSLVYGGGETGGLTSLLRQLNKFLPLAVVLGVMYEVRISKGRRSMNLPVAIACLLIFFDGVYGYSKEGLLSPFVAWLVPAAAGRCKVSIAQIAGIGLAFAFAVYYMVPYSQYGRNFKLETGTFSENVKNNIYLLSHLPEVRKAYLSMSASANAFQEESFSYYSQPQGFMDRLQMLGPDDALINTAENGSAFGIFPTLFYFENIVPHFLWPSKPILSFGNIYAHDVGIITIEDDETTGVSFSPAGDAYYQAKWPGIFIMLPLLFAMLFTLCDSLAGDTRESPFALLLMVGFIHAAPEGMIGAIVGTATLGMVILYFASFMTAYVMPLLANLAIGPAKRRSNNAPVLVAVPGRFAPSPDAMRDVEGT